MPDPALPLPLKYGALPGDPDGNHTKRWGITVVLFLKATQPAQALVSLASLECQSLQPEKILLVKPPQQHQEGFSTSVAGDIPLAERCRVVAYEELAAALFEDQTGGIVFLHAGSVALPSRVEQDELLLRIHGTDGVLSLPIIQDGPGAYPWVPRDPFPENNLVGDPPSVAGTRLVELPGGLSESEWLLDCLAVQTKLLCCDVKPGDRSIMPGLQRCLESSEHILVSERCLTICSAAKKEPTNQPSDAKPLLWHSDTFNPKISIIVPCFNAENHTNQCLDSILAQSYQDFEIICVDDCSTDSTSEILHSYHRKLDGKMKVIRHDEKRGVGAARASGIDHSKCEHIASIDSDDWVETNMLEVLYKSAIRYDADIVNIGYKEVSDSGSITGTIKAYQHAAHRVSEDDNLFTFCIPAAWNKLYKRELFADHQINFPPIWCCEDLATIPRLVARARTISFAEGTPYNYRQRAGSLSHSHSLRHMVGYVSSFKILESDFASKLACNRMFRNQFCQMVEANILWHINQLDSDMAGSEYKEAIVCAGLGYICKIANRYGGVDKDYHQTMVLP